MTRIPLPLQVEYCRCATADVSAALASFGCDFFFLSRLFGTAKLAAAVTMAP
jgi:hypothetical protein